jgi:hypothetical protein
MEYYQEDVLELGDIIQKKDFIYDVEIQAELEIVDHGIGHYEFWGAPGFDSQLGPEVQSMEITYITKWDEDGEKQEIKFTDLTQELREALEAIVNWKAVEDYFCENYETYEPY